MQEMPLLAGSARACTAAAGKAANQELAYYKDTSPVQPLPALQAAAIAAHKVLWEILMHRWTATFDRWSILASLR